MKIINIKSKKYKKYLEEYAAICKLTWGEKIEKPNSDKFKNYVKDKVKNILNKDKVISVLGLIDDNKLIGFISLFKSDGDKMMELTPWYATMYVKEEYRGNNYSKILNDSILKEAKDLGYSKVYLKTTLKNYYEKFGAKYIKNLTDDEKLYYIDL